MEKFIQRLKKTKLRIHIDEKEINLRMKTLIKTHEKIFEMC